MNTSITVYRHKAAKEHKLDSAHQPPTSFAMKLKEPCAALFKTFRHAPLAIDLIGPDRVIASAGDYTLFTTPATVRYAPEVLRRLCDVNAAVALEIMQARLGTTRGVCRMVFSDSGKCVAADIIGDTDIVDVVTLHADDIARGHSLECPVHIKEREVVRASLLFF